MMKCWWQLHRTTYVFESLKRQALDLQSDTSHLEIPHFQGCVSGSQGVRTRIPFRIARPRISIALSGNALARGVANGERERIRFT